MNTREALKTLFRLEDGHEPYGHQVVVSDHLLSGSNAILRAPTGAGKTEAALGPFLLARQQQRSDFPRRCIIASPMRTLAKDLHARAQMAAAPLGLSVKLHTGEDPTDPLLEADIVVTTVDQLLSNHLHVPYSQSQRSRNIGAGGVVASYVVLDEFHLFDPQRAFRTAVEMARALRGVTPFLFMTATMSEHLAGKLAAAVGARFVSPSKIELQTMHSQQKVRIIQRIDAPLTADAVAGSHSRRSIAIANTVDRVQALYAELQRLKREGHPRLKNTELVMLHSRYFPLHRNEHEMRLKELLGRGSRRNVVLVASQAVEVGIDISSEHLHTELCPANALLQRAGRNARYAGEVGVVSVYALPKDERGEWRMLPYARSPRKGGQEDAERLRQVRVLYDTWDALATLPTPIKPEDEVRLVDRVHAAGDEANWKGYEDTRDSTLRTKMVAAFAGERSMRSELIRDVQSVGVLMVPEHTDLSTWAEVGRHERLSVTWINFDALENNRRTLGLEHDLEINWLAKVPREVKPERRRGENETRQPTKLEWESVTSSEALRAETLVRVNPRFVFYTRTEGLRWEAPEGGAIGVDPEDMPPPHPPRPTGEGDEYWYVYESYQEHIERVLAASKKHAKDVWHLCPKVDEALGIPSGTTDLALKAAIAAHDIGKLSVGWQEWTRGWQRSQVQKFGDGPLWGGAVGAHTATPQGAGAYCAHTDYHPGYDKGRNKEFDRRHGGRPPHAGESATVFGMAFATELRRRIGDEAKARSVALGVAGAIARHHSASATGETETWRLDAGAAAEASRVFHLIADAELERTAMDNLQQKGVRATIKPLTLAPTDRAAWLIYTLASRALRLGDTRSFEDVRQQEKEAAS